MILIRPIITAVLFSAFIYLDYLHINSQLINTILGLFSFFLLLTISKKELFLAGFFISNFWFWWIGYSFMHYDLTYLIPLVLIGIGLIYGILFYIGGIINSIYLRAIYFIGLSFTYPFGFNWLQLELPFINSYIGTSKIDFILVMISIILIVKLSNYKKYLAIIPLLFTLNYQTIKIDKPNIKVDLPNINISQEKKWDRDNLENIININLQAINKAIKNRYDLVVLPETTFPLPLNKNKELLNILKDKSKQISILTGALHQENGLYHNSTYLFQNETIKIAHKVVLIPFGEAVPLPQLLRDMINNTFYNGAKDYEPAQSPTDFEIKNIKFRNAICYEATTSKIFENLNGKYIIAISNNAWFVPSIQPTLQNLLLKFYAKKYDVKIYSVANGSKSTVIN